MAARAPVLVIVQRTVAALSLAFVGLVVIANASCAPKYFQRADVALLLALAVVDAFLLFDAASGDTDRHRVVGVAASASAATLFAATLSIPVLFAPLGLAGMARFPRSPGLRWSMAIVIPAALLITTGAVYGGARPRSPPHFPSAPHSLPHALPRRP